MNCHHIRIENFRNIESASVTFDDGVNFLVGKNAQGKTNLLEAISFSALGKSFRTPHEEDMIRFGCEKTEISLDFSDSVREQNITVRLMHGKRRRIEQNRVKINRLSDIVGVFRTVLFCPEHLSLVKDGPGERRNYLDIALSQIYPVYLKSLQRYQKILKQRNQLLRDAEKDPVGFRNTVELWSSQLAHEAAILSKYRQEYLTEASEHIGNCFSEMSGDREVPTVLYAASSGKEPAFYLDVKAAEEDYFKLLSTHLDREIAAGSTLFGAHKDDIDLLLNGKSARMFSSQGQQRSMSLAMKLAEGEVSASHFGELPVFLFDDVFSELDEARRAYLSEKLSGKQVIMTGCELPKEKNGKIIFVENGVYRESVCTCM